VTVTDCHFLAARKCLHFEKAQEEESESEKSEAQEPAQEV